MHRLPSWFSLVFVLSAVLPAHAQGRIECDALKSQILKQPVRYCAMLPLGYGSALPSHSPRRYPVLYFLHGLGDNEQTLFKTGGWNLIEDMRHHKQITDFLIVAPEGRSSFYINSADGKVRYGDFFIREFMPYIERRYAIRRERRSRAISGVSMGGYGALRFAFAYPELFSSVSAQSAALLADSPQRITAALRPGTPLGRLFGAVFGEPIDVQHWEQSSPFSLARQNRARIAGLAIYFNCGQDDEYDFETGAGALHRQLQAAGIRHEFHLYPGNHSATYFLAHLGETLIFHSRAMEGK